MLFQQLNLLFEGFYNNKNKCIQLSLKIVLTLHVHLSIGQNRQVDSRLKLHAKGATNKSQTGNYVKQSDFIQIPLHGVLLDSALL